MKNFGAVLFLLATAGSFVTGTPTFSNEKRGLAEPADLAARALDLSPRFKVENRQYNGTQAENKARSTFHPTGLNVSDANAASSLVGRRALNSSEGENERRYSPRLKRGNFMRSLNETDA